MSRSLLSMLIRPRKDSNAPVNRCTCPSMASNRWLVRVVSLATLSRAWTLASRTAIRLACSTCAALKSTREKKLKKDLNKLLISLTFCEPNPLRLWLSLIAVIIHHHDIFFILIAVSDDWSRPLPLPLLCSRLGLHPWLWLHRLHLRHPLFLHLHLHLLDRWFCRFFPFLTFISSSSESDPESLTGLLTVMVFTCVLFVWSHPYLRALQPTHAAPNSSTSQSLFPLSHRVQAFK